MVELVAFQKFSRRQKIVVGSKLSLPSIIHQPMVSKLNFRFVCHSMNRFRSKTSASVGFKTQVYLELFRKMKRSRHFEIALGSKIEEN